MVGRLARVIRRPRSGGHLQAGTSRSAAESAFVHELGPAQLAGEGQPVTRLLYDRLTPDQVAEVSRQAAASSELATPPPLAEGAETHRTLVLNYGMWLDVPAVAERTGLPMDQPPQDVHAMARGPLAAAGGLYEADMVIDALLGAGVSLTEVADALDFGCSSGRVVRVLATAYPQVRWQGCDPNQGAIKWATEHLPMAEFFVSAQRPPLPIADGQLDLVYAISVWSHFAPALGLRWFAEMGRVIRSGGYLVFTTHGLHSVAHDVAGGRRVARQGQEILAALCRGGQWYGAEFGPAGDAGVIDPDWGTAFLSAEWVLSRLCPGWRVLEFASGRNQGNQDVYVLQRR